MTEPDDRLLDYALERIHGDEEPVDLTERVVQAWGRGVGGSLDVDELMAGGAAEELTAPSPNGVHRGRVVTRAPFGRLVPRLAAAALVIGIGAVWWFTRPTVEGFAVASRAVVRLAPDGPLDALADVLDRGDAVLVENEAVEIVFGSGAALAVDPASVLVLGERDTVSGVELELGSVRLTSGAAAFLVATDFASVHAEPGATLAASVELAPFAAGIGVLRDEAVSLLDPGFEQPRVLAVQVSGGWARLERDGDVELIGPANGTVRVNGPTFLAEEDVELFDELFIAVCLERKRTEWYEMVNVGPIGLKMDELSGHLERFPALWETFHQMVFEQDYLERTPALITVNVLDFLLHDGGDEALDVVRDLWMDRPQYFAEVHIVTLAERELFEFEREVEALVAMYEPDPFEPEPPIYSAAYLAFRGNDAGRWILEAGLEPEGEWVVPVSALCAYALESLGDPDAWGDVTEQVGRRVDQDLAAFELIRAGENLLAFEFFVDLRVKGATPALGRVLWDVYEHVQRRDDEVQTEARIRELLRELTNT